MVNYYDISEDTVNIGIVLFAESERVISELSYNKQELLSLINNSDVKVRIIDWQRGLEGSLIMSFATS